MRLNPGLSRSHTSVTVVPPAPGRVASMVALHKISETAERKRPNQSAPPKVRRADCPEEEWMRKRFPRVLTPDAGRVFRVHNGSLVGFQSHYLLPRCLGLAGNEVDPWAYCPETSEYLHYDPERGIYVAATEAQVESAIVSLLEECARTSGTRRPDALRSLQRREQITPLVKALRSVSVLTAATFEEHDATCIHVRNGILNFRTLELEPFTPERPARTAVPIEWSPSALEPTRFLQFLDGMFRDPDDRLLVIRLIALALLGNPFQKVVILQGRGGSGKSTLVKLMGAIVGEGAYGELRLENSNGRFESARWMHKRLLAQLDASQSVLQKNTHILKALSGQDRMQPELKGERTHVTFVPRALPVITTNADVHLRLEGDHEAWQRRLVILRTEAPPPPRAIPDFERILVREEGPGILRLVAEQARNLLAAGELPLSAAQRDRTEMFLAQADPVRAFVRNEVEAAPGEYLYAEEAFRAAQSYVLEVGVDTLPAPNTLRALLGKAMEEIHGAHKSNSLPPRPGYSTKGWRNFRLRRA